MDFDFYSALITALRDDTTLVSLTTDTSTNRHIGQADPEITDRYPYLAVTVVDSMPAVSNAYTGYKRSVVEFEALDKTEVNVVNILDRIENLLHQDGQPQNVQYWNISNSTILNKWTKFISRGKTRFDDETKAYSNTVRAWFRWNLRTPPELLPKTLKKPVIIQTKTMTTTKK